MEEKKGPYQITELNESGDFGTSLGISEERMIFLRNQLQIARENDANADRDFNAVSALVEASKVCERPEELAYVSIMLGEWIGRQGSPENAFLQLLKSLSQNK